MYCPDILGSVAQEVQYPRAQWTAEAQVTQVFYQFVANNY